jgi:hypothetical protein
MQHMYIHRHSIGDLVCSEILQVISDVDRSKESSESRPLEREKGRS